MKVKELIEKLQKMDPELTVKMLDDYAIELLTVFDNTPFDDEVFNKYIMQSNSMRSKLIEGE